MNLAHLRRASLCFLGIFLFSVNAHAQSDLVRGRQALESGNLPQAILFLEQYRSSSSPNPEVFNLLGIAYGRSGDDTNALAMFQRYANLAPTNPQAFNNLGAAYLQNQNLPEAEKAFRKALKLNPVNLGAMYNLGSLLNLQKKFTESRPVLERAYAREPSGGIAYEYAVSLAATNNRKKALQVLSSGKPPDGPASVPWLRLVGSLNLDQGNLVAANQALDQALSLAPDDDGSLLALAFVKIKEGKFELASSLLQKANRDLPPAQRAIRIGSIFVSQDAYPQALEQFQHAAELDPMFYEAHFNVAVLKLDRVPDLAGALASAQRAQQVRDTAEIHDLLGDIREATGDSVEAVKEYQAAVQKDPQSEKFVVDLATELTLHENFSAALELLNAAQTRFPVSPKIALGQGTALFLSGKTDDSVTYFLKAVDLDPSFEPAYLFLGEATTYSGTRSEEIARKLATLASQKPESFGAQFYYAAALIRQMDQTKSLSDVGLASSAIQKAISLKPGNARAYYQRAELRRLQGRLADAAADYSKAAELDPDYPEPLYKLGQLYAHMGKAEESKQTFARHKVVLSRSEANLNRRNSEIKSFVLNVRKQ